MIRFLHTADWQIGTRFGQFAAEEGALLAEARFETVEAIARLAVERQVDAVLVAGDVFDQQTVTDKVIRRLFAALSLFSGHWIMIPGNHDAAIPESVWTRAMRLGCVPANVRLLLQPQVMPFAEGFSILAAPLTQRRTFDDVTEFFDGADTPPGHFRIGLSHGSVTQRLAESIDSGNPIAADRSTRARLDYLALGDWHGVYQVDERTWYAGTPETDRFRNNRSGFVLEVAIDAPGAPPHITEHRSSKYAWHQWEETLAVGSDVERLIERLKSLGGRDVLSLSVAGSIDLSTSQRLEAALGETAACVRALRSDLGALRLLPTEEDMAALGTRGGYIGKVVTRLDAAQDDPAQRALAAEALQLLARLQRDLGARP
ncbi:DNA repair exonuclease SbcCD nuclease subunit [Noviherbaspirillum humi]|uniref:DNA repair exonuclease SbcCD nuclease subunit n=1 Tax=Noviherbaspirillum humi TaxID=1688639 RepID=A0A239KXE4_9BURK|nr:DNA repair exonuclease [Noviherbaspirillum humi]SNT22891.1 DNA repair exonuclease SbcCD nuclease subunit [Noviherbaspirillum humi]